MVKKANQEVVSFSANKKWLAIPIVDYSVQDSPPSIALEGKCKNCGSDVARYIE